MVSRKISGLYLISDTSVSRGRTREELVREAIAGGAGIIQLRDKWLSIRELYPVALNLREITREAGVLFIVNDSVELAMAVGADGVHLGQEDLPASVARRVSGGNLIVGVSTHSIDEAREAVGEGADYIAFGPIFETTTKDAGEAKGTGMLARIRSEVKVPIVAIGGINAGNAKSVIEAGADAVAVISAVADAEDVRAAAGEIVALF